MKHLPVKTMSQGEQLLMREWAQEHGRAVGQLTIRQTNTKHAAGTLPLHMNRKELPVGEKMATQSTIIDSNTDEVENIENNDEQQSEYEDL